ncbi:MAG TPA: DEAD/DEAH box helicase [Bryobacteraceae bacterium]|nr:DEAD/DEAH box helicase [Bryobacteraceae bacterium]
MAVNRSIQFPSFGGAPENALTGRLASHFSHPSMVRGFNYFREGRVVITRGTPAAVEARVRGHRPYNVEIVYREPILKVKCECEYFLGSGACKHIWATLLAAEEQTFLSEAAGSPNPIRFDDGNTPLSRSFELTPPPSKRLDWRRHLDDITHPNVTKISYSLDPAWPGKRELRYWVDVAASRTSGEIVLSLQTQDRKQNGIYSRSVPLRMKRSQIAQVRPEEDRNALAALAGGRNYYGFNVGYDYDSVPESIRLAPDLAKFALPLVVKTGHCYLQNGASKIPEESVPLRWDDAGPWKFRVELKPTVQGWGVSGILFRGEERMDLSVPDLIVEGGFVFTKESVAPLDPAASFKWLVWLRSHGMLEAPESERDLLLSSLLVSPGVPPVDLPKELAFEEVDVKPRPHLRLRGPAGKTEGAARLTARMAFEYEGHLVDERSQAPAVFDAARRRLIRRDPITESNAILQLGEAGIRQRVRTASDPSDLWELTPSKLPHAVRALTAGGWIVEADGRMFRAAGKFTLNVASGLDWFDLQGNVDFAGHNAGLPELLAAVRRGESMVRLDDGSYGLIPEEWLARVAMVAGMGQVENESVRFRRSQAGLLDALLAAQPEATFDAQFENVRRELRSFEGVRAAAQPEGFHGQLRDYQKEGLGWMEFLRRFSFGGCLADDMGTGKTAQVLALLESRRAARKKEGRKKQPSLVVAPRSLIFNWREEAERFTPLLSILDYTGPQRDLNAIRRFDLVLTTYGTLRRDIARLREVEFDYAVLDEAQAVKNSGSEGAKAVRLIQASHRLALSGTPVENHLGELWSLFEFLNPGMLGSASVFRLVGGAARNPGEDSRQVLAQAVRPFILRRTKAQVARELPERTEQTIYCELGAEQRALYNELRNHYRGTLLTRIDKQGLAKSKIMVLEALLRLRQAACHPGLIDADRKEEQSAKLEALIEQLQEVIESGHKALVFSQFTSLLAIVRSRLDNLGMVYEYLDGKTRDRQTRVEHFQNDPACPLFLISLKAGGLGLNLTAADYVFLMDPWWNPAVEAQAIDRAHRIGQLRRVSAYRLIAKDTVEEKVLDLQKTKRDLAAAIIGESNSLIRDLKREDLELLLS